MTLTPESLSYILGFLGLIGIIFSVFNYFRNPQEALDKREALNQKDADGKAMLLAQQFQQEKEAVERRFSDMGNRLESAMTLAQNHIHTVDTKVDGLISDIGRMSNEVTRLTTVIDERIPKK